MKTDIKPGSIVYEEYNGLLSDLFFIKDKWEVLKFDVLLTDIFCE